MEAHILAQVGIEFDKHWRTILFTLWQQSSGQATMGDGWALRYHDPVHGTGKLYVASIEFTQL
jgi:hypothetical protein